MTLLMGRVIDWAAAVWDTDTRFKTSVDYFIQQLCEVFEYPAGGKSISTQLLNISQGSRTAAAYAIEFHTIAAQSDLMISLLKQSFRKALVSNNNLN